MGYSNPEKVLRLGRVKDSSPSYDIIADFTNMFEDLNIRWLLIGEGSPLLNKGDLHPALHPNLHPDDNKEIVSEPTAHYDDHTRIKKLEGEVNHLKAANKALLDAFRAIGEGRPIRVSDVGSKGTKSG